MPDTPVPTADPTVPTTDPTPQRTTKKKVTRKKGTRRKKTQAPTPTTTERGEKRVEKAPARRARYGWLEPVIITKLIAPMIQQCMSEGCSSKADLLAKMRLYYSPEISAGALEDWLRALGGRIETTATLVFDPTSPITQQMGPAQPQAPAEPPLEALPPEVRQTHIDPPGSSGVGSGAAGVPVGPGSLVPNPLTGGIAIPQTGPTPRTHPGANLPI